MISTRLTSLTPALLCSALECLGRFDRGQSAELREVIAEVTTDARTDRAMRTKLGVFIRGNAGRVVTVEPGTSLRFVEAGTIKKRRPLEG